MNNRPIRRMKAVRIYVQVVRLDDELTAVENQRELLIQSLGDEDESMDAAISAAPDCVARALQEIERERFLKQNSPTI